jgi:hypothetical protein
LGSSIPPIVLQAWQLPQASGEIHLFKIHPTARGDRLEADGVLTPSDFQRIAKMLRRLPLRARKIGFVAARRAKKSQVVETYWNGKETSNTARRGDFIVTNLSPNSEALRDADGHLNVYVISADRFPSLYEPAAARSEHGAVYRAKGLASAIPLPGGLDIAAPWGERQTTSGGYLLLSGKDVYGISEGAFEETYELVGGNKP